MDSFAKNFKSNIFEEIKQLNKNLTSTINIQFHNFYQNSDSILKGNITYIQSLIKLYNNIYFKQKSTLLKNNNYLYKKITTRINSNNISFQYKLTKKEYAFKLLYLFYLVIFHYQISLQKNNIMNEEICLNIKKLYNLLQIISIYITKLFLDKIISIEDLEIILKMLVLFSINGRNSLDIKKNGNLENIMYLKTCIEIIKLIYKDNSSKEEQTLLINIFTYIIENICYNKKIDKNEDNNYVNYTNKFYLLHNDYKTTKLLSLMYIIYKLNNPELNQVYFDLISNIYFLQSNYNNFNWPLYSFLEPLLVNINTKNYNAILNEISFLEFQLNLIENLTSKEKEFINNNPFILKNGFYLGENNNNNWITAEIENFQDNFILTFGFKLILTNESAKNEYTLLQMKNEKNETMFKLRLIKNLDCYKLILNIKNYDIDYQIAIMPFKYYIISIYFDDKMYLNINNLKISDKDKKDISFSKNNLTLYLGCDRELNKNSKKDYIYKNEFTGFIGDVFIINTKGLNKKKKKDNKIDFGSLQDNILNMKGNYGNTIVKSIGEQFCLNEYITSNIDEITKNISMKNQNDFFRTFIGKDNKNEYKLIDNFVLYLSSRNFQLIEYMDNIDYLNYDNKYYKKQEKLNQIKEECQFINNYRIINKKETDVKITKINTKLFNCNFNIFENRSTILKFFEEDGLFYLILMLEYYYQILYKINKDISENNKEEKNNNKNIILSKEQKDILIIIQNNIYNILSFFKTITTSKLNIKSYKITLFFYQINVVIKQYILIDNINDKLFDILITILNDYKSLSSSVNLYFYKYNNHKNSIFDFLLNPNLYKQNENFNLLKNLSTLFESLYNVINDNKDNDDDLLIVPIYNKLLNFSFILKKNNSNLIDNKIQDENSLFKAKKNYIDLLVCYTKCFYSNIQNNKDITNYFNNINDNIKNDIELYYYLCYFLFKSEVVFNVDDNFIKNIKEEFEYKLEEDNYENNTLSSLLLLCWFYLIEQLEKSEKVGKFIKYLYDLNRKKVVICLINLLNLLIKDSSEFNHNLTSNKINKTKFEITNKREENFFCLYFKLLLSLIENTKEMNNKIFIINDINNIQYLYKVLKDNNFFTALELENKTYIKYLFSSQNYIFPKIFYYLLIYLKNGEKIENDIINYTKLLISNHSYPFTFKLLELLILKINKTLIEVQQIETEDYINNFEDNINEEENRKNLIKIVINIVNSIYKELTNNKIELKSIKESNNLLKFKYYLRGIIYLLITIYNISKIKEPLFSKDLDFETLFIGFVKFVNEMNLIYSNNCIKIDDISGKLISELIFDSFMHILMINNNNIQIKELLQEIFVRKNKNIKKNSKKNVEVYHTIFYLMDLLKNPVLDEKTEKQLKDFIDDIPKIKKLNSILKVNKNIDLNSLYARKNLPSHKCIQPINNANFCIFFLIKISIYLFNKQTCITDKKLKEFLLNILFSLLHGNIIKLRTALSKYYNEDLHKNFKLYYLVKDFYESNIMNISDINLIIKFLQDELTIKAKYLFEIDKCYSSCFIWKETEYEIAEIKNLSDIINANNKVKEPEFNETNNSIIYEFRTKKSKSIGKSAKSIKSKQSKNIEINEKELEIIKKNIINKDDYFCFLDDINNRCFIYSPKNMLIKRIFSHIYYNLLFYDNMFLYVKNKYLTTFPSANMETKQLNYPSKIKNFSNFIEPKIFLKKDFNFYDKDYFQISHDYLFKDDYNNKVYNQTKIEKVYSLINSNLSKIHFYEHNFNLNDILEEKDSYFDCELVTTQYLYFGFIIFGKNYIYFGTKDKLPLNFEKCKKQDYDLDIFQRFCFSTRNQDNSTDKKKRLIFFYQDIKKIVKRRLLLMYQAIEIYCNNGKSYFFNFFKKENCDIAFKLLDKINLNLDEKDQYILLNENINNEVKKLNLEVKKRTINNYMYLLKINFFSSRTFNDVNQYPVFPWIIVNFNKIKKLLFVEQNLINQSENIHIDKQKEDENNNEDEDDDNNNEVDPKNLIASINNNQTLYDECGLRVFNYPLSMQTEEKRNKAIKKFQEEGEEEELEGKFIYHHGAHYSTSSYIYFFLMRNNPYTQCMIKLQNFAKENPNRLFISFSDILTVFKNLPENRELIPNLFCHFDYYINLNCAFNGCKTAGDLVDDLYDNTPDLNTKKSYDSNMISIYLKFVYLFRKLLNSNLISIYLPNWLDNVFGKNQLPDKSPKMELSCNIFNKSTYEEKLKLDEKMNKYLIKLNDDEITKKELASKILIKIDLINNFGSTPHRVLNNTIRLDTSTRLYNGSSLYYKISGNIYFIKHNEEILILFNNKNNVKDRKKNNKIKKIFLLKDKDKIKNAYPCGYIKLLKKMEIKNTPKIPIFKPCYIMSTFTIQDKLYIVTCRYIGNIFKIQNSESHIDVLCEDFVNCLVCKEEVKLKNSDIFIYTGLKNGKLIEWCVKNNEELIKKTSVIARKSNYCHKGEITCIELFNSQNIIITGGEDKMIFIRKTYDFELLTVINLTHLYANPIIGKKINIVPTLIKVSELNCIYVMLYNYETNKSFIRGYNLNGLYIAETEEDLYMNICFTKNNNLLISYYDKNYLSVFTCYDLKSDNFYFYLSEFTDFINKNKKKKEEKSNYKLVWFNYYYKIKEFIFLFEDQILKCYIESKEKQINFDNY